jgi:hypothetical protein
MAYSNKLRDIFAAEIEEIKSKGLYKEKRFICSPQGRDHRRVSPRAPRRPRS